MPTSSPEDKPMIRTASPDGRLRAWKRCRRMLPLIEDPSQAGQSHWTAVKLHGWIKDNLQTQLGHSTTVRYLHEHDYRLKVPCPRPLEHDADKRRAFCQKLQLWQNDPSIDPWFVDESGFEGDPRPNRTWAKIGQVRHSPYLVEHIRYNLFGAVRPKVPPRSPDLNPIDRLRLSMKAGGFNGWIAKTSEELQDRLIEALRSLFDQPAILQSQCRPKTHL